MQAFYDETFHDYIIHDYFRWCCTLHSFVALFLALWFYSSFFYLLILFNIVSFH